MRPSHVAAARRLLARALAALSPARPGLRILTYHRVNGTHPRDRLSVTPRAFEAQLAELARQGRAVVDLDTAMAHLHKVAPEAVVLTFDDGYADNIEVASPLLARAGFKATFYVATGLLGTDEVMPRYRGCCGADRMMTWDEVRALQQAGHTIGGHGRQHLELRPLQAPAAREEIEGCARDVEAALGTRPRHFCYPRGSEGPHTRRLVAESGFVTATTVAPGSNRSGQDPYGLNRTEVSGDDSLEDFRLKLRGAFDAWHGLRQAWRRREAS